ncbi:hypothetical protein ACXR0O_20875 [Verrucomicrobiota bacterium sgz303538]
MKHRFLNAVGFCRCLCAMLVIMASGDAWGCSPKLGNAIELLQEAKRVNDPVPLLQRAKKRIQHAVHNKGGRRPQAIEAINEAIQLTESGSNPELKINHAITLIHSGIDRAD